MDKQGIHRTTDLLTLAISEVTLSRKAVVVDSEKHVLEHLCSMGLTLKSDHVGDTREDALEEVYTDLINQCEAVLAILEKGKSDLQYFRS
jgi:hypothetical protein